MTEKNYAPSAKEKKVATKKVAVQAPVNTEVKAETKTETASETKKEEVKKVEQKVTKKEVAVANGSSLPISKKHSMSICKMINGKTPDKAIEMLEEVILMQRAVPMNNREVPHRKGDIMAGRYPLNASKVFIDVLKQLKANSSVNGIDNPVITLAKADKASRPHRRGGTRAKRTHLHLEARDKIKQSK